MGWAVAGEAVGGVGLVVDLHRWRLVLVEGTRQAELFVGFEVVVLKHLGHGQLSFNLQKGHKKVFDTSVCCNNTSK